VITVALGYFAFQFIDVLFFKWSLTKDVWAFVYHIVLQCVIHPAYWLLKGLGYDVYKTYDIVWVTGTRGVFIDRVCIGLDLIASFIILILAYPAKAKFKAIFTFLGVVLIIGLNSLRVFTLVYNQILTKGYSPSIDPHYTFNILVYLIIFLVWALYVNVNEKAQLKP